MSNPLDLDFTPFSAEEVLAYRRGFWSTMKELARHPRWPCSHPSVTDMARRVGVHEQCWRDWERQGVEGAWAALLRVYQEEGRDVSPVDAGLDALEALWVLTERNWSELARWLEVDRRTITKWRYSTGVVPGRYGYGRIVTICYEDLIL